MSKKILFIALLAVMCMAQFTVSNSGHSRGMPRLGGATQKTQEQIAIIQANPNDQSNRMYIEAKQHAIKQWQSHTSRKLGKLVSFSEQVVSGMVFRLTFATADDSQELVQIAVWSQPWTSTLQVTHVSPPVLGWTQTDGTINIKPPQ